MVIVSGQQYSKAYGDIVFVPLTSQPQPRSSLKLRNWKTSGLLRPTWAKPIVATINARLVVKVIGSIATLDDTVIKEAIKEVLDPVWLK